MRENKFRVMRDADEKWMYFTIGDLHAGDSQGIIVAAHTWCEFTGLKDKNGVEIYEGDIVKVKSRNSAVIGPVIFKGTAYGFTVPVDSPFEESFRPINDGWYGTEVIGNIYENPELLEKAE